MGSHPSRPAVAPVAALVAALVLGAGAVHAADGRIELDHARALVGDSSIGDSPGYPVTLKRPGSYVLTGALTPPDKTTAISIETRSVHIDLEGHAILGRFTCAPGNCALNTGFGIETSSVLSDDASVVNGVVRGFPGDCVQVSTGARVSGLHVADCGEDGIEAGAGSDVQANTVQRVGRHGVHFASQTGIYADNAISDSATTQASGVSVSGGSALRGNLCADGLCSTRGARRYYLTTGIFSGSETLAACAPGFHMASALELLDTSALEYATALGDVEPDSGRGPVSNNSGWVRTGEASSTTQNCSAWTSASAAQTAFRLILRAPGAWNAAGTQLSPWQASAAVACNLATNVWCIED